MDLDHILTLDSDGLDAYLEAEVDKIIDAASPEKRDQLRAVHNRARMQVKAAKNPVDAMVRTNKLMYEEFQKLNEALKEFRK